MKHYDTESEAQCKIKSGLKWYILILSSLALVIRY